MEIKMYYPTDLLLNKDKGKNKISIFEYSLAWNPPLRNGLETV